MVHRIVLNGGFYMYTIQVGDTFYQIAKRFQISLTDLLAANPGIDPLGLLIGQQIQVPASNLCAENHLNRTVCAWLPYWVQAQAYSSLQDHAEKFSSISPFWYQVSATGDVVSFKGAEDNCILSFAMEHEISVIPLITNEFNSHLISTLLNDSVIRQRHVQAIVNKVFQQNYAGIDIDYENLYVRDREVFIVFLQELKRALSDVNKLLVVTVHAKTEPTSGWSGSEAHDYLRIGETADIVRIMGYDYHWKGGTPGSIAPADWVDSVLAYAVSIIPKHKIELGIPTYGYDWPQGMPAKGITHCDAVSTASRHKVPIITNPQLGPHFMYWENDLCHEVWFVDASLFTTLLDLVNNYNLRGICMWHLSAGDPGIFDVIQAKF